MMKRHNDITNEYEEISTFYMATQEHNEFIEKMWKDHDDITIDCELIKGINDHEYTTVGSPSKVKSPKERKRNF